MKPHASILLCALLLAACAHTRDGSMPPPASAPAPADVQAPTATNPGEIPAEPSRSQPASVMGAVSTMQEVADELAYLPEDARILVVFDIDDTLLTTPKVDKDDPGPDPRRVFFGSDRWYLWQEGNPKKSPDKATGDEVVPCLFDVIAMNYELGLQEATEEQAPAIIAAIPFDRLVLTSRSADYREATERQLDVAGYPMPVFPSLGSVPGGFGYKSAVNGALVSYANGILMTKGGNKGKMLKELLTRPEMNLAYDAVVLVDDSQDKLDDMRSALVEAGVYFIGLRYEGVKRFPLAPVTPAQKQQAAASWDAWKHFLQQQYPERWERMADKDGACRVKTAR